MKTPKYFLFPIMDSKSFSAFFVKDMTEYASSFVYVGDIVVARLFYL
jgi:hypothetical protein